MPVDDDILFSARQYAADCGFHVLPIQEDKKPACRGGYKSATTTDNKIVALFENCPRTRGVGIRTGTCSGILVLDVDSGRQDKFGHDPLEALTGLYGDEWQDTLRVATPSGGHHFYFRLDEGELLPSKIGVLTGVDIKCERGYVVAPPTNMYRWVCPRDIPENLALMQPVPDWLFELIQAPSHLTNLSENEKDEIISRCSFPLLKSILNDALSKVRSARPGQRKYTLYRQAWRLGLWVPYGMDYARALTALDAVTRLWTDIPREEITLRLVPALDKGIQSAHAGEGPVIPADEKERWRQERELLPKRQQWLVQVEQWLQRPEHIENGVSIDQILEANAGAAFVFRGKKKAARNEVASLLRRMGFERTQVRIGVYRMWVWRVVDTRQH